ncbi:MAG: hypothetical protein ABWZ66_04830 [Pyrinomonadaceae bacterium]
MKRKYDVSGGIDNRGTLNIFNSTVRNNSTASGGGGIKNFSGATANITGSTISERDNRKFR